MATAEADRYIEYELEEIGVERTGQVNHAKVAARHELNSHVLPRCCRILIAVPFDVACRASIVGNARSWHRGNDIGAN